MRRLHLRAVEQIPGQQKHVGLIADGFLRDETKCLYDILVRQPAIQPPPSQMNVSGVENFHRGIDSNVIGCSFPIGLAMFQFCGLRPLNNSQSRTIARVSSRQ